TWQINYNGAMIWDESARRPVFHKPMDGPLVREIVDATRQRYEDVLVSCEILDRWHTDRFDPTFITETGKLFKPDVIADIATICAQPITKLTFLGPHEVMVPLDVFLIATYGDRVATVRTDRDLIQVMDRHVGKAAALLQVCAHYGVQAEEVMAIGDAPNDVGMLQLAGVAVAMDNAHPAVKQVAHWIAPSNNDHGVHAALRRYGLCE
ncbi:MAG: HAD hydrolase family protein, partial [Tepidisphaeraceae bacterium]